MIFTSALLWLFFLNASTHQVKKRNSFTFFNRVDTSKIFKFLFPLGRDRNIDLYVIVLGRAIIILHDLNDMFCLYIFYLCCQTKEMWLSSHTQACGFSPQIYNCSLQKQKRSPYHRNLICFFLLFASAIRLYPSMIFSFSPFTMERA